MVTIHRGAGVLQQAYVKASNTGPDGFATTVDIDGDTIVVGAPSESSGGQGVGANQNDNTADFAGAAYIFIRVGSTWEQQAYLKASNTDSADRFGQSVSVSGDTVVVGAPWEGSNATGVGGNQSDNSAGSSGAVYVFTRTGTSWSQQAYVKASNTESGDQFGSGVAVSGDTLAVAAANERSGSSGVEANQTDNSADGAGAVYIFTRSQTSWSQQAYINPSNMEAQDRFGSAITLSGDTLAVGAMLEDSASVGIGGNEASNSAEDSGAVYVFVRSGSSWSQQAYVKASNVGAGDWFGISVALDGDTLAVGATKEDSNATGAQGGGAAQNDNSATDSGAVYVFKRTGASWAQQSHVKASNTAADDDFGRAVGVYGDLLVVGAQYEASKDGGVGGDQYDNSREKSGAAYLFVRTDSEWLQEAYLKAAIPGQMAYFGNSIAVSGTTILIGAYGEDSSAVGINGDEANHGSPLAGAAYVFH
jgi:hypothetical protein